MVYVDMELGDKVKIGNNIVIEFTSVRRRKVRLGVTAPREIPVLRSELLNCNEVDDEYYRRADELQ